MAACLVRRGGAAFYPSSDILLNTLNAMYELSHAHPSQSSCTVQHTKFAKLLMVNNRPLLRKTYSSAINVYGQFVVVHCGK